MIKIFKTPSCAYCAQTVRYLENKGAQYEVIDVVDNPSDEYNRLAQLYGFSVPLVYDGVRGYCGWNLRTLNQMIEGNA